MIKLVPILLNGFLKSSPKDVKALKQSLLSEFHVSGPARTYILNIRDRFLEADSQLVERLGEANWQRHVALSGLPMQADCSDVPVEEAAKSVFLPVSLFQDSGLGSSLPAQTSCAATSASHTSFISSQVDAKGGGLRVPPTPKAVSKGIPFSCGICGQTLSQNKNRINWKYERFHLYDMGNFLLTFPDDMFSLIFKHTFALSQIVKIHLPHFRRGRCGKPTNLSNTGLTWYYAAQSVSIESPPLKGILLTFLN